MPKYGGGGVPWRPHWMAYSFVLPADVHVHACNVSIQLDAG